jgi:hypothetical protein
MSVILSILHQPHYIAEFLIEVLEENQCGTFLSNDPNKMIIEFRLMNDSIYRRTLDHSNDQESDTFVTRVESEHFWNLVKTLKVAERIDAYETAERLKREAEEAERNRPRPKVYFNGVEVPQ